MSEENVVTEKQHIKSSRLRQFFRKYGHEMFFIWVTVICVCLVSVVIILAGRYSEIVDEQVEGKALLNSLDAMDVFSDRMNGLKYQSKMIVKDLVKHESPHGFLAACDEAIVVNHQTLSKIVYCKDGKLFNPDESAFTSDSDDRLRIASALKDISVVGIIEDRDHVMQRVAICVPTEDHPLTDSIILLYSMNSIRNMKAEIPTYTLELTSYYAFCRPDGEVIELFENKDSIMDSNDNVVEGLRRFVDSKEVSDKLSAMLSSDKNQALTLDIAGASYTVAVSSGSYNSDFRFVGIYHSEKLYTNGYNYMGVILASIVIILFFMLVLAIYFIFIKKSINKKISNFGTQNEQLQCFTAIGFEREAANILDRYKGSRFAAIVAETRRFEYISDVIGSDRTTELLKKLCSIINTRLQIGEAYGYEDHGVFLIMLQYGQYEHLINRLREVYSSCYNSLSTSDYDVKLNFGICVVSPGESVKPETLISNAKLAMSEGGFEKIGGNYTLYDESIRDSYLQLSDLEVKMDKGIHNHEFQVFYQPKYNIVKDCMDGCEALIRWYDERTDSYRPPDSFMPFLETNGYISRLDRYVFEQVCMLIGNCVERRQPIIPISVNVSRMTVLESDFLEFYINTKKKYKIPDRFITLEFTESAAYENYTAMAILLKELHKNGFECSIDDFGTGYSSYNMLKILEIDEVKLDKFFIEGCLNNPRAKCILEGAIAIGNGLKLKVTQEGVEDAQTFYYLKRIGCTVVQGFYYSRPLNEEGFLNFINDHLHTKETETASTSAQSEKV